MKLNYCPECAAPLIKHDDTFYTCESGHPYYNNPRAAAGVILVNDRGELLFAQRAHEPHKGKYDFPGGFVNYGENAAAAAIRELYEEAGIEVHDIRLVGTVSNPYEENVTTLDSVFICYDWTGELNPADDVAAFEWKPATFISSPEFAFPSYASILPILTTVLGERP